MTDVLFKLRVLQMMLRHAFEEWRNDVWKRDLDSTYCCSGYECGCMATSVRELYQNHLKR